MKRRIYKLSTKFTMLGMDAGDLGVLFGTFVVTLNFFQNLGSRLSLFLAIVCTALVFFVWHLVKDKVPDKFMNHLFSWLGEPEVYKIVPDTKNVPLVVDFKQMNARQLTARQINKGNKRMTKQEKNWRMPSGRSDSWL
jgi:hypothetical protein